VDISAQLKEIANLVLISMFLWAGGRITHGLSELRPLAKKTWQRAVTEVIVGFVSFLAIGAVIVLFT